ncbi:membrane protein [Flavobacterium lutivivi]|nr:membrane protein [Flavobacterium lutivivi]
MKTKLLSFLLLAISANIYAQETVNPEKYTSHNKGKFYFFWGGNRESFSKSDIHFTGDNYDFTLYDVTAHDKSKGWHIDYFNPTRITIPQTNLRIGYFINDHYNISIGVDHMKYVMFQDRAVDYTGYYPNEGTYGEVLPNGQILLTEDFLTYEHTDGLNYINTEFCRVDDISKWFNLPNTDKFQINLTEGLGAGFLYPKTNAKLLGNERHDDFHISGYGVSAKAGLNFTFFKHFFLQAEIKGGYIDMNDIRTTKNNSDKASQHFLFLQRIIAFGGIFKI